MKRAILLLAAGCLASALWFASRGDVDVAPEEIAKRCAASEPSWESYQEDIKGQIGAGPVAEWLGHPKAVLVAGGEVTVDFAIAAPWEAYDASLPILLRDSFGATCRHYAVERVDDVRRYRFRLRGEAKDRIPGWVELRYPHDEAWVPLDTKGQWHGGSNDAATERP